MATVGSKINICIYTIWLQNYSKLSIVYKTFVPPIQVLFLLISLCYYCNINHTVTHHRLSIQFYNYCFRQLCFKVARKQIRVTPKKQLYLLIFLFICNVLSFSAQISSPRILSFQSEGLALANLLMNLLVTNF